MNEVYAVLDIGSASIELLVGEIINSNLHVLFSKKVPSHGVKKGIIEDENLLVNDIKVVVQSLLFVLNFIKVIVVYHLVIMIRFLRMIL